jgi:putative tryptophan/tyrosine transport system substrate-binding protein
MTRKFLGLLQTAFLLVTLSAAEAQQPKKIPRIGLVAGEVAQVEAFRRGLRDLGYNEGKSIVLEYRNPEGKNERFPGFVAELVQLKVDVLVLTALPAILAAKQATKIIPIVMLINADPVAAGIVESLARPGGNITGLARLTRELSGKRLELLKEAFPSISRLGTLWNANGLALDIVFKEYEAAARALKIQLQPLEVRGPNPDLEGRFQAAAKERVNGLITITDALLSRYPKRIADLAIRNRLPSMCERSFYVEAGGLMSYSADDAEISRRAAVYVDKILKGAKPTYPSSSQPSLSSLSI